MAVGIGGELMARIRTVKPELFEHEELFDLEKETGLPVRLAFIGLFTCCDREGRFKWRPRTLQKNVLPHDEIDFSRVLDALGTRGFVRKYACGTEFYGEIPTWGKHQVINNRESASDIPPPGKDSYESMTSTREARVSDASGTRGQSRQGEGKGKEGKEYTDACASDVPASPSFNPKAELKTHGVSDQTAKDWLSLRKQKRATVTATALGDIVRQAEKANLSLERALVISCRRGWTGFDATWLKPEDIAGSAPAGVKEWI